MRISIGDSTRKNLEVAGMAAGYLFLISFVALLALGYYKDTAKNLSQAAIKKLNDATYAVIGALPTTLGVSMLLQGIGRKEHC